MKNTITLLILFLIPGSTLFAQLTCGQGLDLASTVDFKTSGINLDVDIVNAQYSGGTCGTINYKGREINGTSGFDVTVNISTASDKILCGLVDGTLPSPLDLITVDPTFRCAYNILNMEGYIEAYAISANANISSEKRLQVQWNSCVLPF